MKVWPMIFITKSKAIMAMMDNHDMSRLFTELKGDLTQTKMALSTLLLLPRIPQIYYGTEILMQDFENPGDHGLIRTISPVDGLGILPMHSQERV